MKKFGKYKYFLLSYLIIACTVLGCAGWGSRIVTVISENAPIKNRTCIVIDAGHGGEDGGATSCTGVLESQINLEISLKLNDLLQLFGFDTCMIRTTDQSIYTQGSSLSEKKVSDLKERVRIVNSTDNAILVSIHQNQFAESKYRGAQVFYASKAESKPLAQKVQSAFINTINPDSNRTCKKADGIYLMQNITCTGILVECGFLSNPEEEALLRNADYQRKIAGVIAATLSLHVNIS